MPPANILNALNVTNINHVQNQIIAQPLTQLVQSPQSPMRFERIGDERREVYVQDVRRLHEVRETRVRQEIQVAQTGQGPAMASVGWPVTARCAISTGGRPHSQPLISPRARNARRMDPGFLKVLITGDLRSGSGTG